jgi:DNA polymerase III alpha subunit (gram-positive type)
MEKTHIFFDLETTGLGKDCDIVQIATVHENGKTFNRYIIPEADIGEGATKVNGITKVNGELYKDDEKLHYAVKPYDGLKEFLDWINENNEGKNVILIAHNALRFDAPILINNILKYKVKKIGNLCKSITGFGDTILAFKGWGFNGPFNQQALMSIFGMNIVQSHDALQDAQGLKALVTIAAGFRNVSPKTFLPWFKYTRNVYRSELTKELSNLRTTELIRQNHPIPNYMAPKNYNDLSCISYC